MDDNRKLHNYNNGLRCVLHYIYGNEQAAIANADGFYWSGSTNTHDRFYNPKLRVYRFVNKDTKRFYERQLPVQK